MLFFSIRRPSSHRPISLSPKTSVPAESGLQGRLHSRRRVGSAKETVWSWCGVIEYSRRGWTRRVGSAQRRLFGTGAARHEENEGLAIYGEATMVTALGCVPSGTTGGRCSAKEKSRLGCRRVSRRSCGWAAEECRVVTDDERHLFDVAVVFAGERNSVGWNLGWRLQGLPGGCNSAKGNASRRRGPEITERRRTKGDNLRWQWCEWW
ncbi:hypothetical protein HN51_000063 [Arachis hypogaea]